METEAKARVFISCGQSRGTSEELIANELKSRLIEEGYDAYVAINDQTTEGLKENILAKLSESEYFIFIDFKREELVSASGTNREFRGSLFANQELAIAISQNKRIMAFQEAGIVQTDGMLKVVQVNPICFPDRAGIIARVIGEVRSRTAHGLWDPKWRDEIILYREESDTKDVYYAGDINKPARFFHIRAENRNIYKTARNCICFITEIINIEDGRRSSPELVEIKWKNITSADIYIPPSGTRKFDGFHILKNRLDLAYLGYNRYIIDYPPIDQEYQLKMPGHYDISYMVHSENFRPACATFRFELPLQIEEMKLIKQNP